MQINNYQKRWGGRGGNHSFDLRSWMRQQTSAGINLALMKSAINVSPVAVQQAQFSCSQSVLLGSLLMKYPLCIRYSAFYHPATSIFYFYCLDRSGTLGTHLLKSVRLVLKDATISLILK